ncbi:MAG TPA: hypothetical protein VMA72_01405 [Streptosporangiaceae bacterium]|nr:hypothetical protein [Streptosporangiaceae bacterium]
MAVLPLPRGLGRLASMLTALLGAAVTLAVTMPAGALAAETGPAPHAGPARASGGAAPPSQGRAAHGSAAATATTLSETGARPDGVVTLAATVTAATVTGEARTASLPVSAGTVSFYGNGASRPLGIGASGTGSAAGVYTLSARLDAAAPESVVAIYAPPGGSTRYRGSRSAAVSVAGPACSTCAGVQTTADIVPAGVLSISTPYTASEPLDLGTLALNPSGTFFSASAPLDPDSSDVPSAGGGPADPAFNGITVVDTQVSNLPWTITAWASDLGDGGDSSLSLISGEDVGLTDLTVVPVPDGSVTAGDLTFFDQPAAHPPVGPADTGSLGLGGQVAHVIVTDAGQAEGTIGINGTITVNAPTSTEAGTFGGTIVLTLSNGTPSG